MIATGKFGQNCVPKILTIVLGTLALGINAPAKTAVFAGDSPWLTALMVKPSPSSPETTSILTICD